MSDLVPWSAPYAGWAILLALTLAGAAIVGFALFADCARDRRCPRCGYNLSHTPGEICSECGRALRSPRDGFRTRRHWRWAFVGMLVALALPAFVVQRRVRAFGWDYYTYVGPLYWLLPDKTVRAIDDGHGLRVRVEQDRRRTLAGARHDDQIAIASIDGREVWRGRAWYVFFGTELDGRSLVDVDGDGRPEAIVSLSGGGNSGIARTFVLRCDGGRVANLNPLTVDCAAAFADVDRDGRSEMIVLDRALSDFRCEPFNSKSWRLIFAIGADGRYAPSPALMARDAPDDAAIARDRDACRRAGPPPAGDGPFDALFAPLVSTMADLAYAGRIAEARAFLDDAWPGDEASKRAFATEFDRRLSQSAFGAAVGRLRSD